jgi:serine/threonine protein kinase
MPGFADKDIIREINIMKNLDHPHVIKIFEFYRDDKNYYLINEYCTEGDLSEKMIKLKQLPEPIVKILMAQIFSAVLYLNNRGIIHGDLKLENILVDSYLDDGNVQKEKKSNFISSLIQDARNVQNYLRNINVKRGNTTVFNRKKIQEKLNLFKKSDKSINRFKNNKVYLYENPDNIINEETKEAEINNEETKDNYEPLQKVREESNIFGFQSNDEDEDDDKNNNESDYSDNDSSDICKSLRKNNNNQKQNKISEFKLEDKLPYKIKEKNISSEFKIGMEEDEDERIQVQRKINKRLTYNYNKLNIKNFELKLIDFGCSKIFSKQKKTTFEDTIGTLVYCSPEVLKNNYDQKCDIWSCGVIMYRLLCGRFPFNGRSEEEITKKILFSKLNFNNKYFQNISENAKDLIRKCLIRDKDQRISVKEALKHEFFAGELNINNIFEDEVNTKILLNNLKKNARKTSKFYQIVLTYLSYNFADKEHLQRLRNIFYKIDLNMDGKLSREELYTAYKEAKIDISKEELNKIIKFMDFDGNGYIEYEEFIRVTLPKEQLFTDINLKNAFEKFDKNKNGTISVDEIIELIGIDKELDKSAIEELKKEVSYDGDKEIDFKHFKDFMLGL